MKPDQRLWTRDELLLAVNLYYKLTFGQLHSRTPAVIHLASLLRRTPSAVAMKLGNLASIDSSLTQTGMRNGGKLDRQVWDEFHANWSSCVFESETLLAHAERTTLGQVATEYEFLPHMPEGRERQQLIRARVNQGFFRKTIIAAYDGACCITGLRQSALLVAGHIRPWSEDADNRMNPRNGLALNALHDRAFELGLFTIRPDNYAVEVSKQLLSRGGSDAEVMTMFLGQFHGRIIHLPSKRQFLPDPDFLAWHQAKWR